MNLQEELKYIEQIQELIKAAGGKRKRKAKPLFNEDEDTISVLQKF